MRLQSLVLSVAVVALLQFAKAEDSPPSPGDKTTPFDIFNYALYTGDQIGDDIKTIINKTLNAPKKASYRSQRSGNAVDTHACGSITSVPTYLTFITRYNHYRKYTHAYGIPILGSNRVRDDALKRACYVVRFLLADRPRLRQALYKNYGRLGIMAQNEGTTSIPEHRHLGSWWDQRARGLGGTLAIPISTGGEENLLCLRGDRYSREDIFLHEFSHGIQEVAIRGGGIPGYFGRLQRAYNYARSRGLWRSTYSMSTVQEYFAEGVQSYFQVNDYSATPNGVHGPVNTRAKLQRYDPTLYKLIREVFPCGNVIHDRCARGSPGPFRMNCDGSRPVVTVKPVTVKPRATSTTTRKPFVTKKPTTECIDNNRHCASWQRYGYCQRNKSYMLENCKKSCKVCSTTTTDTCTGKTNNHRWCGDWARRGYCSQSSKHHGYMTKTCQKSCCSV